MRILGRAFRLLSLVVLAMLGTTILMYSAPGYFVDSREMDAPHGAVVRADLEEMKAQQGTLPALVSSELRSWSRGDLGQSRQYGVPVTLLLRERAGLSARVLVAGVAAGWLGALLFAVPLSLKRSPAKELLLAGITAPLLAVPVGVLATLCMVRGVGGPVLVLAVMVAGKDFKLIYRVLQETWNAPWILYARAQGFSSRQILQSHIAAMLKRELLSMAVLSFTLALSALVPVEVIFDKAGLGQLAWSAAMNRDLPVLVAVTVVMATCVGLAGLIAQPTPTREALACA